MSGITSTEISVDHPVHLRDVEPDDYDRLAGFLDLHHEKSSVPDYWKNRFLSWWDRNPYFEDEMHRGWVLEHDAEIVGFFGVIPSLFQFNGEELVVYNTTTWVVLPEFRHKSLQLFFKQNRYAKDSVIFVTTPNDFVIGVLERLKFKKFPKPLWPGSSVIPLNPRSIIEYKFFKKGAPKGFGVPLDLLAWVIKKTRQIKRPFSHAENSLSLRKLNSVNESFDYLWQKTKGQYGFTNVRNSTMVDWLCFANPQQKKQLVGCFDGDELQGFAIYRLHQWGKLKVMECLDLWSDHAQGEKIIPLVARYIFEEGQKNQADLVLIQNFSREVSDALTKLGFWQRNLFEPTEYYFTKLEKAELFRPENTFFCKLQGDYAL